MIRILFFLAIAVAVAWGVVWLAQNPGDVTLNWGSWRVDTSAGVLAAMVVGFAVIVAVVYRVWLVLTNAPKELRETLKQRRKQRGYKALTKGMVAVSAGDGEEAAKQVGRADGLLGEPPLTLLLKAQSAQLNGDEKAAENFFKAMLQESEMEFLGLRGLMNQALKRGDHAQALKLAHRARALKPKSPWLAETLFDLEGRAGDWMAAGEALTHVTKLTDMTQGDIKHRQAVVALGRSLQCERDGDPTKALRFGEDAVSADTSFTAGALRLAALYLARGHTKKARDVIEKAWAVEPHPDFVAYYYRACNADDALEKVSAAEKLLALKDDHIEGHLSVGEAALNADLWGQARTHFGAAMELGCDTRRVYSLMARLEEDEHSDTERAHHWWVRASAAQADPAWVCSHCGHVEADWAAHCPRCATFDALHWTTPPGLDRLHAIPQRTALAAQEVLEQEVLEQEGGIIPDRKR